MSRRQRNPNSTSSNRWLKVSLWSGGVVVVLVVAAMIFGRNWLQSYLRSRAFTQEIEKKVGAKIRAKVDLETPQFSGSQIFSTGMKAQGGEEARFSSLQLDDIRGEVDLDLKRLWSEKYAIRNVEVQRLKLDFTGDRVELNLPPYVQSERKVDVTSIAIHDVQLDWKNGGLKRMGLLVKPDGHSWNMEGQGGVLHQAGMPDAEVFAFKGRKNDDEFFLQKVELHVEGGTINATGEVVAGHADADLKIRNVAITQFLPEDWRARLHGKLAGDVQVSIGTGPAKTHAAKGSLRLEDGVLEAVPILEKLATFTKTDRFRRLNLTRVSADFEYGPAGLKITNLIAESDRLIVIRGEALITGIADGYKGGVIDGTFEVGVIPSSLAWLPGSQEKVFTTSKDGYACTTMRVTGPLSNTKEDLSGRLAMAAGGVLVDKAGEAAAGAAGAAGSAVKEAVGEVLGKGLDFLK